MLVEVPQVEVSWDEVKYGTDESIRAVREKLRASQAQIIPMQLYRRPHISGSDPIIDAFVLQNVAMFFTPKRIYFYKLNSCGDSKYDHLGISDSVFIVNTLYCRRLNLVDNSAHRAWTFYLCDLTRTGLVVNRYVILDVHYEPYIYTTIPKKYWEFFLQVGKIFATCNENLVIEGLPFYMWYNIILGLNGNHQERKILEFQSALLKFMNRPDVVDYVLCHGDLKGFGAQ